MTATSQSLLDRLQRQPDAGAWQRWLGIYEPWLRGWLKRHPLQQADVEDLLQSILEVVARKLPVFVHSGQTGAFRAWLRTILTNQVRAFLRSRRRWLTISAETPPDWLEQLEDPDSLLSRSWDREHDGEVVRRLLASIQGDFHPRTWEVFSLLVLENRSAEEVAQRFGMERNAVYVAKSRVLSRLRQELRGLIEM